MARILIADDDPTFGNMVKKFLERNQYETEEALTGKTCMRLLKEAPTDLVLVDFRLPDMDGLDLLREIKSQDPKIPVILITSYANIRTAVKAMQMGAFEYLTKPVNPDELLLTIKKALISSVAASDQSQEQELQPAAAAPLETGKLGTPPTPRTTASKGGFQFIQGESAKAGEIARYIDLIAPTNLSVIIQGESGTGKEYVSRMIHQKSHRAKKPFVAIDCGALSENLAGSELFGHIKGSFTGAMVDKEGQFQAANGGTLFLDEIGNLSYEIQIKLLRALQEGVVRRLGSNKDEPVDVRIIVATNEDLADAAKRGDFREDLYHRLNEFKIQVPPLRERKADIPLFAEHFLQVSNQELNKSLTGFEAEVIRIFETYPWPGNLREFKNVVRRAVLLSSGPLVVAQALPPEILHPQQSALAEDKLPKTASGAPTATPGSDLKEIIERNERETIVRTLEQVKYNKSKAAKLLNIDRKTLYNKLKAYGIDA